jgi:hypothetical protein
MSDGNWHPAARRWKVLVPGIGIVAFLAALAASSKFSGPEAIEVCLCILAGPFAEPFAYVEYSWASMIGWGAALLLMISAHSLRPHIATGIISIVGLFLWLVFGLCYTFSGV